MKLKNTLLVTVLSSLAFIALFGASHITDHLYLGSTHPSFDSLRRNDKGRPMVHFHTRSGLDDKGRRLH